MDLANLVNMANRIAEFHAVWPDPDAAALAIAEHIRKFWAPRMRRELLQNLESPSTAELHPLACQALKLHRDELMPFN